MREFQQIRFLKDQIESVAERVAENKEVTQQFHIGGRGWVEDGEYLVYSYHDKRPQYAGEYSNKFVDGRLLCFVDEYTYSHTKHWDCWLKDRGVGSY